MTSLCNHPVCGTWTNGLSMWCFMCVWPISQQNGHHHRHEEPGAAGPPDPDERARQAVLSLFEGHSRACWGKSDLAQTVKKAGVRVGVEGLEGWWEGESGGRADTTPAPFVLAWGVGEETGVWRLSAEMLELLGGRAPDPRLPPAVRALLLALDLPLHKPLRRVTFHDLQRHLQVGVLCWSILSAVILADISIIGYHRYHRLGHILVVPSFSSPCPLAPDADSP
jgi:hypothetical protein